MNARHAARELALLTLFQLDKQGKRPSQAATLSVKEMVLVSVRTLSEEAKLLLENAASELADVSRAILDVEMDHPINLNSNMDALIKPVPMPSTRETVDKIERCLQAAEYVAEALRIPELAALAKEEQVMAYATQLIKIIEEHQTEIDELINHCSADWRVDRMVLLDAWILRLAAAEMKYMDGVDISVSIDEAVELAKDFSTEESFKYINGVLGALAKQLASPAA
ncbi:MAG: transcription antitermination factor NusB [Vampirovibrionales bacterium]|nr:transcription antitermination factor NusB [Vampirovibrionales bacterium]